MESLLRMYRKLVKDYIILIDLKDLEIKYLKIIIFMQDVTIAVMFVVFLVSLVMVLNNG